PPEPAEPFLVDPRLGGDYHARFEHMVAARNELWPGLVVAKAGAVPRVVGELLEAVRGDDRTGGGVDVVSGRARCCGGERRVCGGAPGREPLALPAGPPAGAPRSRGVGPE